MLEDNDGILKILHYTCLSVYFFLGKDITNFMRTWFAVHMLRMSYTYVLSFVLNMIPGSGICVVC